MPDGSAVSKKTKAGPISADRLKSFVERIEKLEEERKAIGGDIRDVYSEAKGVGYDIKTMRKIISIRKHGCRRPRRAGDAARHLQARARHGLRHQRRSERTFRPTTASVSRCTMVPRLPQNQEETR